MSRTTKLTPELMQSIFDILKEGHFPEVACESLGIHRSTYYRWIERGKKDRAGIYCEFCDGVMRAKAKSVIEYDRAYRAIALKENRESAPAVQKWLEWHDPEDYTNRVRVEQTVEHKGEVSVVNDRNRVAEILAIMQSTGLLPKPALPAESTGARVQGVPKADDTPAH